LRNLAARHWRARIAPHLDGSLARPGESAQLVKGVPPEQRLRVDARDAMLRSESKVTRGVCLLS
jgi:hypothetical protein